MAEVTAAGERPASERRAASAARDRADSTFDGIAAFATAVGAVADPVTSTSSVPAVTCASPAVTSAMSLTVTFAPRAAAVAVNERSSACDPPLKPTRTGLVLPASSDAATMPTTTRTVITIVPPTKTRERRRMRTSRRATRMVVGRRRVPPSTTDRAFMPLPPR